MNKLINIDSDLLLFKKLSPVLLRELYYIEESPISLYQVEKSEVKTKIKKNSFINNHLLKELLLQDISFLYAHKSEKYYINKFISNKIYQTSRSLSIGNPSEKTKTLISLMCLNQKYIMEDVTNEDQIKLQYQSAKNLCYFLLKNIGLIDELYNHILKQKFYFLYSQPILSSLFMLGLIKYSSQYTDKNIEELFIASIFKDVGMSMIPTHALNKEFLNDNELNAFINHPIHSTEILKNTIPLSHKYLNIIIHHHIFSQLHQSKNIVNLKHEKFKRKLELDKQSEVILGTETILIYLCNIITTMITKHPYRKALSLFETLKTIKPMIFEQYPMEFQLVIKYFNRFLKR